MALRSGEGSRWDEDAARVAFPLRMSMTWGPMGKGGHRGQPWFQSPSWLRGPVRSDRNKPSGEVTHPEMDGPVHTRGGPHVHLPRASLGRTPGARTHPAAASHHERRVVVAVLEAAVSAAADQRAHEWEQPAARRRVQGRAARVHLGVHVGAVLQGEENVRSGAAPMGRTCAGSGRLGAGANTASNAGLTRGGVGEARTWGTREQGRWPGGEMQRASGRTHLQQQLHHV